MNETSKKTVQSMVDWITIGEDSDDQRLDNFLIKRCKGLPKSHIYRMVRTGEVRVNKARAKISDRLKTGDVVRIPPIRLAAPSEKSALTINPKKLDFDILFEDQGIIGINKPAGVAVHGGSGISLGVIEAMRKLRPTDKFLELVHRLDRDTSGVLLIASKRRILLALHEALRLGKVSKHYLALVHGDVVKKQQEIKLPLMTYRLANGERRTKIDRAQGKAAHTIIQLLHRWQQDGQTYCLVEALPKTGRTHQIRAHLAALGCPIVGDDKYGNYDNNRLWAKKGHKRMFLHASELIFIHPATEKKIHLQAALPETLQAFIDTLDTLNDHEH